MRYYVLMRNFHGQMAVHSNHKSRLEAEREAGEQIAQGFYSQVLAGEILPQPDSDEWGEGLEHFLACPNRGSTHANE